MITTYHRPQSLDEALQLLAQPNTLPLGGGTVLNTAGFIKSRPADFAVVDLQALGLDRIHKVGNNLEIGACVTLEQLGRSAHAPDALKQAARLEAPLNLRNAATVAGSLVSAHGRSPFATLLLALDTRLTIDHAPAAQASSPSSVVRGLGDLFALRSSLPPGSLITKLTLPLNARLAFEMVARTPTDRPIVCAALAGWTSGRTRLALGGWGPAPVLAMDGTEPDGLESAARSACEAAGDEWASAEYRMDVAATLARRCLEQVRGN